MAQAAGSASNREAVRVRSPGMMVRGERLMLERPVTGRQRIASCWREGRPHTLKLGFALQM
jgi:hypothetical protein